MSVKQDGHEILVVNGRDELTILVKEETVEFTLFEGNGAHVAWTELPLAEFIEVFALLHEDLFGGQR
jgi:hypothetical protein